MGASRPPLDHAPLFFKWNSPNEIAWACNTGPLLQPDGERVRGARRSIRAILQKLIPDRLAWPEVCPISYSFVKII